jgi:hypothetical protein
MPKCNRLYKLIAEADVFTAPSKDDLVARLMQRIDATKNPDGSYDATGDITIERSHVKDGKLLVHFNKVSGEFNCSFNSLTSLEGCPKEVGGSFYCSFNSLTSLEGCPKKVGGNFYCDGNKEQFMGKDVKAVCNVGGYIHV